MPATFVEKYKDCGYDGTVSPPWLLVETKYSNWARLRCTGDGKGWKLTTANKGIAIASFTGKTEKSGGFTFLDIKVDAQGVGTTYVTASGTGADAKNGPRLEVQVTGPRHIYVNFHFVTDGRKVRTQRNSSDVKVLLEKTTDVYEWQANTYWHLYNWQEVKINLDFVSRGQSQEARNKIWKAMSDAAKKFDASASHFNLFCVRDWGIKDTSTSDTLGSNVVGGNIGVFQDGTDHLTVAHELGHGLGLRHRDEVPAALMYYMSDDGKKLFRDEVRKIKLPDTWGSITG